MSLSTLPVETLQQILGHFCLHCTRDPSAEPPLAYLHDGDQAPDERSWYSLQRHTLFSVCLLSKRLCSVAQPILYHEFILGYGDSWRSDHYTWDGRLTSFIIAIARRRDLATLVKRVYIHPYLLERFDDGPDYLSGHPRERDYITDREAGRAIRALEPVLGIRHPPRLKAYDLVTILLAALPHLERCSLQLGPYCDRIVRGEALSACGVTELPIRTLDISLGSDASRRDMFHLGPRARALFDVVPYLETLNLHMCGGIWAAAESTWLPKLKNLHITFSRLTAADLRGLLNSCAGLRSFTYEASRPSEGWWNYDHFQLQDAIRYLYRHRETLESLHLDLRKLGYDERVDPMPPGSTLREFPALKHLLLDMQELHRSLVPDSQLLLQHLPPSIQSFHLVGWIDFGHSRKEAGLLGLVEAISLGGYPNFKELKQDERSVLKDEAAVSGQFARVGVTFGYDVWPSTLSTLGDADVVTPWLMIDVNLIPLCEYRDLAADRPPWPDEEDSDL
ncbi:uncharacterized protein BJX67DRAFT_235161 [Aspergillus lucknowensis]|uniref:F-box domain-containing protein n=1 Tax=Aspergillus lucknowensis TaxID=176173 RepID=A0ABR4LH86_9EURO